MRIVTVVYWQSVGISHVDNSWKHFDGEAAVKKYGQLLFTESKHRKRANGVIPVFSLSFII